MKTIEERFWLKVNKESGKFFNGTECWEWVGTESRGYGKIYTGGRKSQKALKAHRVSYALHHGEILEGLEINHLCENKSCVNPNHLEAVDHFRNMQYVYRSGICKRGHLYDGIQKAGRYCRTCRLRREKENHKREREK